MWVLAQKASSMPPGGPVRPGNVSPGYELYWPGRPNRMSGLGWVRQARPSVACETHNEEVARRWPESFPDPLIDQEFGLPALVPVVPELFNEDRIPREVRQVIDPEIGRCRLVGQSAPYQNQGGSISSEILSRHLETPAFGHVHLCRQVKAQRRDGRQIPTVDRRHTPEVWSSKPPSYPALQH
jgi:hypothetical protein